MKKFNQFLESYVDIDDIRKKAGSPSYKDISNKFSGDRKFDDYPTKSYTFEVSITFDGFNTTILEGQLEFGEIPQQSEIENKIKQKLKVFHNIDSYQILSIEPNTK